jgi:hypothetical protein
MGFLAPQWFLGNHSSNGWFDRIVIAAFDRLADHSIRRHGLMALAQMDARAFKDMGLTPSDLARIG